ncbi:MAG TPA: aminotransferase class III-fold pyridoxal phosphate-dependent enzyme, partial [Spongiibacteraceae bacterium]
EIEALTRAFREAGVVDSGFCAIGSVKGNFGHLVAAAGVVGLIKTSLALYRRQLPASLHYSEPNPAIDFANSPFFVNSELAAWEQNGHPLRAAVSSFGVGGTNAHVVLEQASPSIVKAVSRQPELLLLSAKNSDRLEALRNDLADFYAAEPAVSWRDIAWTLQKGRARFKQRQWVVLDPQQDAAAQLREPPKIQTRTAAYDGKTRGLVFMFPGQGSQYVAMGLGLYSRFVTFRRIVDNCCDQLQPLLGRDLREVLFPADPTAESAAELLRQTQFTQPALFVIEYALARLWQSWGIEPTALIGHSIGEFVAAALAGVFSLEDGLRLVAARAGLMQAQPSGAMIAVAAAAERVAPQLPANCAIAAINGPELCVVAGPHTEVETLSLQWQAENIQIKALHTSHAFHSPMMDVVIAPFTEVVNTVALHPPKIPVMSTVDATWLSAERATSRAYWARHLRETVRFADGVRALLQEQPAIYLEVGPRNTAATLAAQQMRGGERQPVIASLGSSPVPGAIEAEQRAILAAAGDLWCQGRELDWLTLHGERPTLESIPTYPFARDRHWLDVPTAVVQVPMLSNVLTAQTSAAAAAPFLIPQNPTIIQSLPVGNSSMDQATLLLKELFELFAENSGEDLSETPPDQSFLELGFDSLFLTQAALSIKKRYKVEIPFRRLLSDVPDFGSLAALLITQVDAALLPNPGAAPASTPAAIAAVAQASLPAFAPAQMPQAPIQMLDAAALSGVQGLIQQQLQLMARQLEMLGAAPATYSQNAYAPAPTAASAQAVAAAAVAKTISPVAAADEKLPAKPFGAQARIDISGKDDFTPAQRQHYQQLVAEYTQHTAKSKAFTEKARLQLSDPRVVSGFRPAVKEITYPIVVNRSKGVRFWDIDGNEYIDTLCGYGSMFFGYQPDWIVAALTAQLQEGMEIGPQHPLTHEVIQLLNEFLPHERYAFCNTGSEAVLGAMRMARTNTGRDKIVMFNGDYHGIVDEVIVRGGRNHKSFPAAAGIMADAVKNMVILEYGSDEALDYIRDNADDIAGVLVETVQSRHPALVPIEFLKKLRELTRAKDVAMIFDEVITGFRVAPGGFQEYAGIQADICTYGKVIGGGVSLGIIAGFAKYMDTLDGGAWQFGDDSKPEVGVTY